MSNEVISSIIKISGELGREGISKSRKNQHQGYSFRGIDDVLAALSALLVKHEVCILPNLVSSVEQQFTSKNGAASYANTVIVDYKICHRDGSSQTVRFCGTGFDTSDKASNKALSAAYKYMAIQTFCIPVEGIPDADEETIERPATKPTKPSPVVAHPEEGAVDEPVNPLMTKKFSDCNHIEECSELYRFKEAMMKTPDMKKKLLEACNKRIDEIEAGKE